MATDATGTPTTNFSFPTYNPAVDAPSGEGLNNIIEDVDSKLGLSTTLLGAVARSIIRKAGTLVGTRRALNFIEGAGITITANDDAANEEVELTFTVSATFADRGTSLPASPADGDEYVYIADAANDVEWKLKYVLASDEWRFIGGAPLMAEVTTAEATSSATYAALTTAGPEITVPLTGTYDVEIGAYMQTATTNAITARMSYDIEAVGAVDADSIIHKDQTGNSGAGSNPYRRRRKSLTAADTLTAKYKSSADGTTFENRWMAVTPVRIAG